MKKQRFPFQIATWCLCAYFVCFSSSCYDIAIISVGDLPALVGAGESFSTSMTVSSVAKHTAGPTRVSYHLSYDKYLSDDDLLLGSDTTAQRAGYLYAVSDTQLITMPHDLVSGHYYFLYHVEPSNDLGVHNNTYAKPIEVVGQTNDAADLIALDFAEPLTNTVAGKDLYLYFEVKNFGHQAAPGSKLKYYIKPGLSAQLNPNADMVLKTKTLPALAPHQTHQVLDSLYLPINLWQGNYSLFVELDTDNDVAESNEQNNIIRRTLFVFNQFDPPQLLAGPQASDAFLGGSTQIDYTLNTSRGTGYEDIEVHFVLSKDRFLDYGDQYLGASAPTHLLAGHTKRHAHQAHIPEGTSPGSYWILFVNSEDALSYAIDRTRKPPAAHIRVIGKEALAHVAHSGEAPNSRLHVSPNPVSERLRAQYTLSSEAPFVLSVIDHTGHEVMPVAQGQAAACQHSIDIAVSQLKPGAYRLVLWQDGQPYSRAFVVY